ncbi:protein serine threonine kinase, putative [Ichthyophthirius multifiliis]|uniref:Protein serine threonine kinase, putative n=1 Tax=Ichthyophthirius multifiliis TaxID=5932 RepID=G0QZA5_ICHMU|nr:protein serine threonine kinase, putative [Ichthyophthirius multifiliis]EGR29445.1 protein serine threonine kinase, putative [Ichthyophthirius multifiliis]|eukprot:XP_004030681.1 protein serine threonine kinase, putative [Ichthyophthirius multifiliis]
MTTIVQKQTQTSDQNEQNNNKIKVQSNQKQIPFKNGTLYSQTPYSTVYQSFDLNTGKQYLVKSLKLTPTQNSINQKMIYKSIEKQFAQLRKLRNRNLVKYINSQINYSSQQIQIIYEFVPGGSISHMIKKFGPFNEKIISKYVGQILQGLEYLHKNNIIHKEIKGSNALIDTDGTIKLTNFGIQKNLFLNKQNNEQLYNKSPEQYEKQQFNTKTDVWDVGCLVIQMLTGVSPFRNLQKIQIPDKISVDCQEFLQKCLKDNACERSSISELMQTKFIQQDKSIIYIIINNFYKKIIYRFK